MKVPSNLLPDSTLVDETLEFVRANGGRVRFTEIADSIFRLSNIDNELAASVIADLVQNDPRFILESEHLGVAQDSNSALLNNLEFVVLDVEATHDRRMPARIIELGAYRVRGREILDSFETLINPEVNVPKFLANLTGISTDMLVTAPKFGEIAHEWLELSGSR